MPDGRRDGLAARGGGAVGDELCHRQGPGWVSYQWPDAVSAGLISEDEVVDKPRVRADIVAAALGSADGKG
jgi:hypothetical protein